MLNDQIQIIFKTGIDEQKYHRKNLRNLDNLIVEIVKEKKKISRIDLIEMIENSAYKLSFVPSHNEILMSIRMVTNCKRIINQNDIYLYLGCT